MIVSLKASMKEADVAKMAKELKGFILKEGTQRLIVTSSKLKSIPASFEKWVKKSIVFDSDIQLASRKYQEETRTIYLGNGRTIGGITGNTVMIAGPCSVESKTQIKESAELLVEMGIGVLRGGCYKPRTSPYSFQGLGLEGLKLMDKMRKKHGLSIITEVKDATHVADVIEYTDIIQVGAKAMYDHGILRACGQVKKPVMIKRGFGSTLQETVQAAEFILSGGNPNVILCERGIRTFESKTRFTLDLCGVAFIKEYTNLPVILDPSHAMGFRYGIADLTRACVAMGVDGLIIEVHPKPDTALSDAAQQLNHADFKALYSTLAPVATAVGRQIV